MYCDWKQEVDGIFLVVGLGPEVEMLLALSISSGFLRFFLRFFLGFGAAVWLRRELAGIGATSPRSAVVVLARCDENKKMAGWKVSCVRAGRSVHGTCGER